MSITEELKRDVLAGKAIDRASALKLAEQPPEELFAAADEIRSHFCGTVFDMCSIINGKSGRCPENCRFCAQSGHYHTKIEEYPLLGTDEIVRQAEYNAGRGVPRYSIVTSGKRLDDAEIDAMCESIRAVKRHADVEVCASFGLQSEEQFRRLREAGAHRVHCNLETSERFFPQICTTHTYAEKIETIRAAKRAGMSVCSGGIIGLGESMDDRIDMALTIRSLDVGSVPVNFFMPIAGTPLEHAAPLSAEEKRRVVAVFRFLLPKASIRLAGGRGSLEDLGEGCFRSGANAAITGDMLTTSGSTIDADRKLVNRLGYQVGLWDE